MLSSQLSRKHRLTLKSIFEAPTKASIRFADIEKLFTALGGRVGEVKGSQISLELSDNEIFLHRPEPGKEAMKYQAEAVREILSAAGVENG